MAWNKLLMFREKIKEPWKIVDEMPLNFFILSQ